MSRTSSELIFQRSIVIRAGAGAGKTTTLIQRVGQGSLQFFEAHGRLPRVVVTTFTRKATQEVRERLLKEALSQNNPVFLRFVQSTAHLHISTLHGVFAQFLRAYGQVRGLTPLFAVITQQQDQKYFKQAVRESLQDSAIQNLCQHLLNDFEMPQLSRMLEDLVFKMQENSNLQFLSAQQLERSLREAHNDFILRREDFLAAIEDQELNPSWQEYRAFLQTTDGFTEIAEQTMPRKSPKMSEAFTEVRDLFKRSIQRLHQWSASAEFSRRHAEQAHRLQTWAQHVQHAFESHKRQANVLSQRDLETFTLNLLREFPVLGNEFANQWDYWMVDEYQDTSPVQVEILKHLSGGKASFTVGDPQQSLYLFRGARKEVFAEKIRMAEQEQIEIRSLMHNHRSQPHLVPIFNEILKPFGAFEEISAGREAAKPDSPPWSLSLIQKDFVKGTLQAERRAWEIEMALRRAVELQNLGHSVCILARKNSEILLVKKAATQKSIRLQAQTPAALSEQSEIQDALVLLRFGLIPADNFNLMCLLKSPLMGWSEADWVDWNRHHLWETVQAKPEALKLKEFLKRCSEIGLIEAWKEFLLNSDLPGRCWHTDPSGQKLANFWKVLQVAHQKSREGASQFLTWLSEALNPQDAATAENAEAMMEMSLGSIQAMTVHAAKGLQFDHVIVLGCGSYRANPSRSWVQFFEEQGSWALALPEPTSGDRSFPLLAEDWLEIKKNLELEEYDRVFYVAATRAAESLTLIWSERAPSSWAARFPTQWSDPSKVQILSEVPEPLHQQALQKTTELVEPLTLFQPQMKITKATEDIDAQNASENAARAWRRMQASIQGQRVHLALQKADLSQPGAWLEKIQNPHLRELIFNGHREWAFQIFYENEILSGQIDLWGVTSEQELWIVDYKTGKNAHSAKTWKQLSIYRNAVVQIFPEYENLPWTLGVVQTDDMSLVQRKMQDFRGSIVFADGAASGNPGPAGWGSIVYADGEVREYCGSAESATNNQMELWAVIQGLRKTKTTPVSVYSDSTYVLQGITQWLWGWKKRDWLTAEGKPVANKDLWQDLEAVVNQIGRKNIHWHYVRGHAGVPGNERCDEMAQAKAQGKSVKLYSGSLLNYSVELMDIPEDTSLPERTEKTSQAKTSEKVWYLSEIGGEVFRHETWESCQNRVKGKSRARFKKVKSADEEMTVLEGWNLSKAPVRNA